MKKSWWKILAVVIMAYVFIAGFMVPLKPGIYAISDQNIQAGTHLSLTITGYNSYFLSAENSLEGWLKLSDNEGIKSKSARAISENIAVLEFAIPISISNDQENIIATLYVDNDIDGTTIFPNAISIRNSKLSDFSNESLDRIPYEELQSKSGFLFPYRNILHETIRNTFFHISLWFSMFILLIASLYYNVKVLRFHDSDADIIASAFTKVAVLYGLLGIATGSIWARYTWGAFWTTDIKLNMAAIAMLIYLGYIILRASIDDVDKRARISAVYSLFAFAALIPLVFIIPRLTSSLHPGSGGNPALGGEDLDSTLRMIFYPSIIGMTLLGLWISSLVIRIEKSQGAINFLAK